MTQIGIMIEGQNGLNWERWHNILKTAEDAGYQCVFRSDHFTNAQGDDIDSLELWTSLTYAASHTSKIEFGPLVTPITFRHPSMTVRYAAAVDDLSDGRLVLGMGAGWQEREHVKFGVPFYDFPTRYDMLNEGLEITTQLFRHDEHIDFEGDYFTLKEALLLPRPKRAGGPPILIGGNGPKRTLPLAAIFADEWNAVFIAPDVYEERTRLLNELLDARGRKPQDVKRSLMTRVLFSPNEAELNERLTQYDTTIESLAERGLIAGTKSMIVDQIGAWTERGVERFMLQWLELDDLDNLQQMAQDILPHFHQ